MSSGTNPSFAYSDFTPVKSKKRKNKQHIIQISSPYVQLERLREQLKQDDWFEASSSLIQSSWDDLTKRSSSPKAVLCLGLGSPTSSHNARIQLAFMTEICALLQVATDAVSIYDPVFTPEDVHLLEQLQMNVLSETNTKHYELKTPTLCFMPHCDIELYEALLRTNAGHCNSGAALTNLYLVGNALREYIENKPKRVMENDFPYLLNIAPFLECTPLPVSTTWPTAFNNTSIQFVRRSSSDPQLCDILDGINIVRRVVEADDVENRHETRQSEHASQGDARLERGASGGDKNGAEAPLCEAIIAPEGTRADRGDDDAADQGVIDDPVTGSPATAQGKLDGASSGVHQHELKGQQRPEREHRAKVAKEDERERGDQNGNKQGNSELEGNMPSEKTRNDGESLSAGIARKQNSSGVER